MKKAALLSVVLAFVATSCGLKGPALQVVAYGKQAQNPNGPGSFLNPSANPTATSSLVTPTGGPSVNPTATSSGPAVPESGMFPNETEGITKNQITICGHVPITGAAPIPHAKARFGQFFFDWVNAHGGIYGRKVKFDVYDDGYYPAGARAAVENCAREGSFIYFGAAGTDQIVSVAKWAEQRKVPYFHGPTSDKDLANFKYSVATGPNYEYQSRLLADYLVRRFGTKVPYGMIRINSPYFQSAHDAFLAELTKLGAKMPVDEVVQKDEKQFQNIFVDMQTAGVQVINNFTTPNIWLTMLQQKPASYNPEWSAISPIAGFNIVATALKNSNSKAVVFSSFNPACNCTYYNTDLDTSLPWYSEEKAFLQIFKQYSPEQDPPPDDFDFSSFLAAKALWRIMLKLGPNPTRTGLFKMLQTYQETTAQVPPGACPADFRYSNGQLEGGWDVNVFELTAGKWKQIENCTQKP